MEKFRFIQKDKLEKLPKTSGVYTFNKNVDFLYIGKAINIKQRVKNHIQQPVFKDNIFVPQTNKIGFIETNSEIEALLLEAKLIKQYKPKYNTDWKDDKNYIFVFINKEECPLIFTAHRAKNAQNIGPFVDSKSLKQTLKLLRRVFPYRTCRTMPKKPCLYKQIGLCSAPCVGAIAKAEYKKNIKNIMLVLQGKKTAVLRNLKAEMQTTSKDKNYEKAAEIRDKIYALEKTFANSHILQKTQNTEAHASNVLKELQKLLGLKKPIKRIEGYDISNIQGKQAAGAMVVFENGAANKDQYRKFKIKLKQTPDDTSMLKEILTRRLNHKEWPSPEVVLIDGGKGQLNAGLQLKVQSSKLEKIKFIALAKKQNQLFLEGKKSPLFLKDLPQEVSNLILQIRDEAHRFAISYHKKLRSKNLLGR